MCESAFLTVMNVGNDKLKLGISSVYFVRNFVIFVVSGLS